MQKFFRGWAYSDLWNLDFHLAKLIAPRLRGYLKAYKNGKFGGLCPNKLISEYKEQLILEGYAWNENTCFFEAEEASIRLSELWIEVLESMVFSMDWIAQGEPIPGECEIDNPEYKPGIPKWTKIDGKDSVTFNRAALEKIIDKKKYAELERQVDKGLENFWKYFRGLWD